MGEREGKKLVDKKNSYHLEKKKEVTNLKMTVLNDWVSGSRIGGWVQRCRESRQLVLVIVAIALLLDNMLLTTVGKYIFLKYYNPIFILKSHLPTHQVTT